MKKISATIKSKVVKSKANVVYVRYGTLKTRNSTYGYKFEDIEKYVIGYGNMLLVVDYNLEKPELYKTINTSDGTFTPLDMDAYNEIIEKLNIMNPYFRTFLKENRLSTTKILEFVDKQFVMNYLKDSSEIKMHKADWDFLNEGIIPYKPPLIDAILKIELA